MTPRTPDPLDELHHADPVHSAPAPSESKARVWARVQEVTMDRSVSPHRTPTGMALGLAGLAAAAAIAVAVFTGENETPAPADRHSPWTIGTWSRATRPSSGPVASPSPMTPPWPLTGGE